MDFGAFLRSRRDRVLPLDVDLPNGHRRRVVGLRRDEVAQLAHLSVDYYVELERGKAHPSAAVIAALADALRVSADEREHLYNLTGRESPRIAPSRRPRPAMHDLLDRLASTPAYITDDLQVVLMQNALAEELHGSLPPPDGVTQSFAYRWFTDRRVRDRFPSDDHDTEAKALVADLRSAIARRAHDDSDVTRLIGDLSAQSAWFSELWNRREVAVRRGETKRLLHPRLGMTAYSCHALMSEDATQRLIWYDRPR